MGFFQNIFKGRIENRAAGAGYRFPFGSSSAGKIVNERTAMQISAVNAAVRILSESIASLPLHVYHKGEDGSRKKRQRGALPFFRRHGIEKDAPRQKQIQKRQT